MTPRRPSVRGRLFLALGVLAAATLIVGATSWITLRQATDRMDRLHDETLTAVDRALILSRQTSGLATRAPYLLTMESPFRIRMEADAARGIIAGIAGNLSPEAAAIAGILRDMDASIAALVDAASARSELTDRILRRNARIGALERRFSTLAGTLRASFPEGQDWLKLQSIARALQGAGRTDNLVTVGEFQREYNRLVRDMAARPDAVGSEALAELRGLAEGPTGLFELRRLELARQIAAEAALARIRRAAEGISLHATEVTAAAQAEIAGERARTLSALDFAKGVIVLVGLLSTVVALVAALFVSGHVTANLRAISDAMARLAVGDRSSRLPRGEHAGDEIGKLFHAFRAFRANTLRLDRSNRQLAQRNALFQNLYDGMSDGLAILSDTGALIAGNRHLASVLRLAPEAMRGRPEMQRLLTAGGWRRSDGAEGFPEGFAELHHPDGRVVEVRESRLATGGSVMLLSDASERHELAARLRQVQRTEALGKIAGEVAHDFGNILTTITTSLHLLETTPPDRATSLRKSLASALDLGSSLTQRLLAFARRSNLEPEVMDLNDLVAGVEDLIGLALDDRIALSIVPAPAILTVRIDPGQMESALLNLCLNAAQAIPGTGRIDIRLTLLPHDRAQIEVCDTGVGMSPEVQAHAMEPFFTARADGAGTGLGLAMVYGFIRQSGGDVEIDSSPGLGTCVRLTLPLCSPEDAQSPAPLRVLLIEDDPGDAAHARRALPQARITETSDAAEAQALLRGAAFDLVLTDLHLGAEAAGWRLAEAALRADPHCRAVVVSGRLPEADPLTPRFPGRAFRLAKPLDPAALAARLQGLRPR
ncbi:signal transduction histidine kinase [Cereibacter changlensis]|uniref:histidine kinase n=1 Tax=Cereibacter changlensis TaxID=402884 RepID=A0A2W7RKJ7_9RHOB|nr:ATP-binding protein [Cereibacter changlensis]PZX51195.1 signal transduction histidine kinase [Cereibacter changlensis]